MLYKWFKTACTLNFFLWVRVCIDERLEMSTSKVYSFTTGIRTYDWVGLLIKCDHLSTYTLCLAEGVDNGLVVMLLVPYISLWICLCSFLWPFYVFAALKSCQIDEGSSTLCWILYNLQKKIYLKASWFEIELPNVPVIRYIKIALTRVV